MKDEKTVVILNRKLVWKEDCIEYEADEQHAQKVWSGCGLESTSTGLDTPSIREDSGNHNEDDECLNPQDVKEFRGLVATANYSAQDPPDIQFATKEVCRCMLKPTRRCWVKLKRIARYLLEHPRAITQFKKGGNLDVIKVFTDSDWAGCRKTRKSTSGGIVVLGGVVKGWSSTQPSIALSSGEAEYSALVKAAAEGIGLQSILRDLGFETTVELYTDSSAAKSIASRIGVGKVRHIHTKLLWIQEAVRDGRNKLTKISGGRTPADGLSKPMSVSEMNGKLQSVGIEIVQETEMGRFGRRGAVRNVTNNERM